MNLKTYTWIKYFATLGSILLLINPLMILLKAIKPAFFIHTWTTLFQVSLSLYLISILFFAFYFWLRLTLIKKSGYNYTKKDQLYLGLSLGLYFLAVLMTGLDLIVGLMLENENQKLTSVFFGISFTLIIIGVVGGAINESLSRVQEQIQLYQKQQTEINALKKNKRHQLLKDEIQETEIEATVMNQRTKAAQDLISRSHKKTQSQVKKKESQVVNEAKERNNDYNPFLDPELNQELKKDPQFQEWLANNQETEK